MARTPYVMNSNEEKRQRKKANNGLSWVLPVFIAGMALIIGVCCYFSNFTRDANNSVRKQKEYPIKPGCTEAQIIAFNESRDLSGDSVSLYLY